jgi:hypothetical protein
VAAEIPVTLVCLFYSRLLQWALKPKPRGGLKMIIQSIVYVVLSLLTATAAFASSVPFSKVSPEQHAAELEKETLDTPHE